jgi:hypothetical protein
LLEIDFSNFLRLKGPEGAQTYLGLESVTVSLLTPVNGVREIVLNVEDINRQNINNRFVYGGIYVEDITTKTTDHELQVYNTNQVKITTTFYKPNQTDLTTYVQ